MTLLRDLAPEGRNDAGVKPSEVSRTLSNFDACFMLKHLTLLFSLLDTVTAALEKTALRFYQAEKMLMAVRGSE